MGDRSARQAMRTRNENTSPSDRPRMTAPTHPVGNRRRTQSANAPRQRDLCSSARRRSVLPPRPRARTDHLDLEAQILRYHHVETWRVGTIARQLHVHHGTVMRVLAQAGLPRTGPPARRSQVEPYLPFIHATLEKFPTLTASRLYAMVCERGYCGSGDHFRHLIA